jgi:hypothetical protein
MYTARHLCPVLTKFGFSRQIFLKILNTKFHGNPLSGSHADTCGRTDRRTKKDEHDAGK